MLKADDLNYQISAQTWTLKSSSDGADTVLAGRAFQGWIAVEKNAPL